ncbi:MAG: methyltransferase [Candidatus Schekmanbacteria bacterium]|nr:methyltransferase [Candidatus Schekmanbacteria bacterium]
MPYSETTITALDALRRALVSNHFDGMHQALRGAAYFESPMIRPKDGRTYGAGLDRMSPTAQALLRTFYLGEAAEAEEIAALIGEEALAALVSLGLVAREANRVSFEAFRLVPYQGQFFWVNRFLGGEKRDDFAVYLGPDSYALAQRIPACPGKSVLDVCSGSGVQAITAAARMGVETVVGLELLPEAIRVAEINAALNGVAARVQFRRSDLFAALAPGETFDLILCNPPFVPCPPDLALPEYSGSGPTGTDFMARFLTELPRVLARPGRVRLVFDGYGDQAGTGVDELVRRFLKENPEFGAALYLPCRTLVTDSFLARLGLTILMYSGLGDAEMQRVGESVYRHFLRLGFTHTYPNALLELDSDVAPPRRGRLEVIRAFSAWHPGSVPEWCYRPDVAQRFELHLADGAVVPVLQSDAPFLRSINGQTTVESLLRSITADGRADIDVLEHLVSLCAQLEEHGAMRHAAAGVS